MIFSGRISIRWTVIRKDLWCLEAFQLDFVRSFYGQQPPKRKIYCKSLGVITKIRHVPLSVPQSIYSSVSPSLPRRRWEGLRYSPSGADETADHVTFCDSFHLWSLLMSEEQSSVLRSKRW